MTNYTWLPFFRELLSVLCEKFDSKSLAPFAHKLFGPTAPLNDKFVDGSSGPVKEMDPLTFIGYFNRSIRIEKRIAYCVAVKEQLGLKEPAPADFLGIPIINNQASWFFPYAKERDPAVFPKLWSFARALNSDSLDDAQFAGALSVKGVGLAKLTQISFICKPDRYLPLDKNTTAFLVTQKLAEATSAWREQLTYSSYALLLSKVRSAFPGKTFAEVSHLAWAEDSVANYWVAGSHWRGQGAEADRTQDFVSQGVWLNGFDTASKDPSLETVKKVSPGDWIAIKSSSTKGTNHELTFLKIKAIGRVKENFGDGVRLSVDWIFTGPSFDVDGISYRKTFETVRDQDVDAIFSRFTNEEVAMPERSKEGALLPSSINTIYWGPPGTGKTFRLLQLQEQFRDINPRGKDHLISWIQDLGWWEVIAAALIDISKPVTVPELFEHEFIQIKTQQSTNKTPKNTLWGQLQIHTVRTSKTVNFESRQEPLVVDKSEESKWSLVGDWQDQLSDLVEAVKKVRSGTSIVSVPNECFKVVTFHQSYSYEDFVEGIRPERAADGSGITYQVKDGIFKQLCLRASQNPEKNYAIFIDEINRGNISKVFGELITLIEADKRLGAKRQLTVTLPYSGATFGVPKNLYVIGTMNSVDRSIALVDMALRRRFDFITIRPDSSLIDVSKVKQINLKGIFEKLNEKISVILGTEYQIGHSYFMNENCDSITTLKRTWFGKVLPLLQEYLFDDWDKLEALVGDFVKQTKVENLERLALPKTSFGTFINEDISDNVFIEFMRKLE